MFVGISGLISIYDLIYIWDQDLAVLYIHTFHYRRVYSDKGLPYGHSIYLVLFASVSLRYCN